MTHDNKKVPVLVKNFVSRIYSIVRKICQHLIPKKKDSPIKSRKKMEICRKYMYETLILISAASTQLPLVPEVNSCGANSFLYISR